LSVIITRHAGLLHTPGGYGEKITDTVEIHCNTIRAARSIFEPESVEREIAGIGFV
jgi:hypothetical protein